MSCSESVRVGIELSQTLVWTAKQLKNSASAKIVSKKYDKQKQS